MSRSEAPNFHNNFLSMIKNYGALENVHRITLQDMRKEIAKEAQPDQIAGSLMDGVSKLGLVSGIVMSGLAVVTNHPELLLCAGFSFWSSEAADAQAGESSKRLHQLSQYHQVIEDALSQQRLNASTQQSLNAPFQSFNL